jgi:hypothetical protein
MKDIESRGRRIVENEELFDIFIDISNNDNDNISFRADTVTVTSTNPLSTHEDVHFCFDNISEDNTHDSNIRPPILVSNYDPHSTSPRVNTGGVGDLVAPSYGKV